MSTMEKNDEEEEEELNFQDKKASLIHVGIILNFVIRKNFIFYFFS